MKQPKTYHNIKSSRSRFHVEEGGTRSGKTYSILTALAELCYINKGCELLIDICRVNGPAIDAGPLADWREILRGSGWWNPSWHDKKRDYHLFGNEVRFFSVDQAGKMKGRKRHIMYMNEANRFTYDAFHQLNIRTTGKMIMDYNPDEADHWIYDKVLTRDNAELYRTTYKDNPFLPAGQVAEIEALKDVDDWYWQVYGLGLRAANPAAIYRNYEVVPMIPDILTDDAGHEREPLPRAFGLDFGFSADPSACVLLWEGLERQLYAEQVLYQRGLTNPELAELLREEMEEREMGEDFPVACDSAEPKSIQELRDLGINAYAVKKGADSVRHGIRFVQSLDLKIVQGSEELIKEIKTYKWKQDANGNIGTKPVDWNDHMMDALRYGAMWAFAERYSGDYAVGAR